MAARNLFQSLAKYGDDSHFAPVATREFKPTTAPAGSAEKIEALAYRVERGLPLWHPEDGCQDHELVGLGSSYRRHGLKASP